MFDCLCSAETDAAGPAGASAVVEDVLSALSSRLDGRGDPLASETGHLDGLASEVSRALAEALTRAPGAGAVTGRPWAPHDAGCPAESLRMAAALFEVALPAVLSRYATRSPAGVAAVSTALHSAIMEWLTGAALAYDVFLREASRREERLRIARELHDRVAHGIGLALQNFDLHQYYAGRCPERARTKLATAVAQLRDALSTASGLASDLRRPAPSEGIKRLLRDYLAENAPPSLRTSVRVSGEIDRLAPGVGEQIYLIVREAIRNAVRHAHATRLRLVIEAGHAALSATVVDDGCGFDPVVSPAGSGLRSMLERAQSIHATVAVTSARGRGTTVRLRVPLPGGDA
jgi:signal transduction histidine kinase